MDETNKDRLDHAVDDLRRALGTQDEQQTGGAVSIPLPELSSPLNSPHSSTNGKTRSHQSGSNLLDFNSMDDDEALLRPSEHAGPQSSSDPNWNDSQDDSLNNNDDDTIELEEKDKKKKNKTLFAPLMEGSKEKKWGAPNYARLKRLAALGKSEKWKILGATIALLIASLANLTLPAIIGKVMDGMQHPGEGIAPAVAIEHGVKELREILLYLVVIMIIIALSSWVRSTLFDLAGEKIVANLRLMLFDKLLTMEIAFYDINRTGELVNRLSSDATLIQNIMTTNTSQLLRNLAFSIGGLIILFKISWKLTMCMFVIMPVVGGISVGYGQFIKKLSKRVRDVLAAATTVAEETIGSMRTVKAFGAEAREGSRYADKVRESYVMAKKRTYIDGAFEAGVGLILNICLGGVLWFGGYLVLKGEMTPGTLTSFVLYVLQVAAGCVSMANLFGATMKAMGASERIFELLDREPTVRFTGGQKPAEFKGDVAFEHVHFKYPARIDHPVLKDLNLSLKAGQTLALVGPSGGGKSTIAHLLLGLYYPTEGRITIDGVDSTQLDPAFLRKHIAVVSQEPTLFAASIRDNICYGVTDNESTTEGAADNQGLLTSIKAEYANEFFSPQDRQRRVEEVARMSNAHGFVNSFPEGYDTMVGERGIRLSGGQKQRIAIARALLKDPKILILDEATSALDAESEHLVKEALDQLLAEGRNDRAYLVIAHRLSTVKNAHQVAVVLDGRVVELGTHDQLLALDGVYKKLVARQLSQD